MHDMPVRRMNFEFPEDTDLVFIEGDPALSYFFVGAWMMLPYLEPYLIRTMQAALEQVDDPVLKEDIKRFCAQEGQHYRQHAKLNALVRRVHPSAPRLAELEAGVEALFSRWSAEKPLRFNLAYGEGFEAMTCAGARTQFEVDVFGYMKEPIRGLMQWHIMEEIEHRTVCFEAYERLGAGYAYRVAMSLWFQRHYLGLCRAFAGAMIAADPKTIARYDTPEWETVRKARMKRYMADYLPRLMHTFAPWYDPSRVAMPAGFQAVRDRYTTLAASVL